MTGCYYYPFLALEKYKGHLTSNCRQEGVCSTIYKRIQLTVETLPEGKLVDCVAYQIVDSTRQKSIEEHGPNLIPSLRYKNVIITGAIEHGLPEEYVKQLEAIPDNGYNGDVDVNIPLTNNSK